MTTREQIEALMAGTEGVTPGPWRHYAPDRGYCIDYIVSDAPEAKSADKHSDMVAETNNVSGPRSALFFEKDAAHIARCSPEVIRDLCTLALKALDAGSATGVADAQVTAAWRALQLEGWVLSERLIRMALEAAALARPVSPEVKPVAWRASINPFGQPGFRYAETEQELIRGGLHKREPLYPNPPVDSGGLRGVAAERERQIAVEGWTPEHDDQHINGQMAGAAACYALTDIEHWARAEAVKTFWPWDAEWWKPKDRRSNLIRAAALLVAEIDRLDRAALKGEPNAR